VDLIVLTPENSTSDIENYGTTIESLLAKKSEKYDIYFFYASYSKKYYNHFIDLRKYLPKESIELFDESILQHQCTSYNDKLVGLVINIYKYFIKIHIYPVFIVFIILLLYIIDLLLSN